MGAGLASVASPCVLPVLPIILTGTAEDHRYRPLLVVIGLGAAFVLMGVAMSLFGSFVGPYMIYVEKAAGSLVIGFGLLMLMGANPFKSMSFLQQISYRSHGRWSGLFVGLTLGVIWIPCVGPMLSGVLATVATRGHVTTGVVLLAVYSLGFAIPMLLVAYFSHWTRVRLRVLQSRPVVVRWVSGALLTAFGVFIVTRGVLRFGW